MARFLLGYTVKDSISGRVFGPCDVFQIVRPACQLDRCPSFSVSLGDGSNRAGWIGVGIENDGSILTYHKSVVSRTIHGLEAETAAVGTPMIRDEEWQQRQHRSCTLHVKLLSRGVCIKCMYSRVFIMNVSLHASACQHLLQCALWQDVSHHSHTDPDCSSHYITRGYPLTWKPSNHGQAEQLAQTSRPTLMDLLRSKLRANVVAFFSFFFLPWIPNFKKDVICFSWL